jgi:peptidoglycan hydrolase CwlO-like protein
MTPVILGLALVLIPLAAIAVGGFREWKAFAEKNQRQMESLAEYQDQVTSLNERVQNLEALVTSRMWNALDEDDPHAREAELTRARLEMGQSREPSAQEKAARLARKMGV